MSLLHSLLEDSTWDAFLSRRLLVSHMSPSEARSMEAYINERRYRDTVSGLVSGDVALSIPVMKQVGKMGTDRKRTVFTFDVDEMMFLKVLTAQLHSYDDLFTDDLYSFRRDRGVKEAIRRLIRTPGLDGLWCYKADVSDYFNSIDVEVLMPELERDIDDPMLTSFMGGMLRDPRVIRGGKVVTDVRKGAMAGVPTSSFIANHYLSGLDRTMGLIDGVYMRYSDDIILLTDSESSLMEGREMIHRHLESRGLRVNPSKEKVSLPGEPIEFLGFIYHNGIVDISPGTVSKTKAKIRRSARSIRRWMLRKGVEPEKAMRVMTRKFNGRFFGKEGDGLSWSHWFLPVINTDSSLHEVDSYMQMWLRWIVTGRHSNSNNGYVPYTVLRDNGYRTLVNAYHARADGSSVRPTRGDGPCECPESNVYGYGQHPTSL